MADPITEHKRFSAILGKSTGIEYKSIEIPEELNANNLANTSNIASFLGDLIPGCKSKLNMNNMRDERLRRAILDEILGKSGIAINLKKIKSNFESSKKENTNAFKKISNITENIANYDAFEKLNIGDYDVLIDLTENYLLGRKATTEALGAIKSNLAELEERLKKKLPLEDDDLIKKWNMYIRLDKIAVSLIILYCSTRLEIERFGVLEGQKVPQQQLPQVKRARPNQVQQPQQQQWPQQQQQWPQQQQQWPQQQQQQWPQQQQQQWPQQQQQWPQQQQQQWPQQQQQQWPQQQQQQWPQQQQQQWPQQQQQQWPQQQQQQWPQQQQVQEERERQFKRYNQQADENKASRDRVRDSIQGDLEQFNQQLTPLYNYDKQCGKQCDYLNQCLNEAQTNWNAYYNKHNQMWMNYEAQIQSLRKQYPYNQAAIQFNIDQLENAKKYEESLVNINSLKQLVAQAEQNLFVATSRSVSIEAQKKLKLKTLEDEYQKTALNEFELISSQPKNSLPDLNSEEQQFLGQNAGVASKCFENYTKLSKLNKQMAVIGRKINKIKSKYRPGVAMSDTDSIDKNRLENELKRLETEKQRLGYNENNVVESQANALNNLLSKPELLDNPEYRKQAIFLFKQLNVMGYGRATSQLQTQVLDQILYTKDEYGNIRYKASAIKLLSYFSKPKTLTSQDLKKEADSATKKPMSNYVRSKVNIVLSDMRIGMEEERDFVESSETLDIYNEAFSKAGLSKDKIHHIMMGASQSNGLESVSTSHSRFSQYVSDKTQGPGNKNACPHAAALCDAMYEAGLLKDLDTAKPIIDYLAGQNLIVQTESSSKDIGTWIPAIKYYNQSIFIKNEKTKKANYLKTRFVPAYTEYRGHDMPGYAYPFYKNGYIQPSSLNIEGRQLFSQAMKSVQCSYMSQECSSDGEENNDHTQNFAAAFSYQDFGNRGPLIDNLGNTLTPEQRKEDFIRNNLMNFQWVYPQYNNIIKQAIIKSAKLPDDNLIMVHLTRIGQGAFGNPRGIPTLAMAAAILENKEKLRGSNIVIQKEWLPQKDYEDAKVCLDQILGMPDISKVATSYLGIQCYNAIESINKSPGNFNFIFNERTVCIPESLS